jgi:hypothetical protein
MMGKVRYYNEGSGIQNPEHDQPVRKLVGKQASQSRDCWSDWKTGREKSAKF